MLWGIYIITILTFKLLKVKVPMQENDPYQCWCVTKE